MVLEISSVLQYHKDEVIVLLAPVVMEVPSILQSHQDLQSHQSHQVIAFHLGSERVSVDRRSPAVPLHQGSADGGVLDRSAGRDNCPF